MQQGRKKNAAMWRDVSWLDLSNVPAICGVGSAISASNFDTAPALKRASQGEKKVSVSDAREDSEPGERRRVDGAEKVGALDGAEKHKRGAYGDIKLTEPL